MTGNELQRRERRGVCTDQMTHQFSKSKAGKRGAWAYISRNRPFTSSLSEKGRLKEAKDYLLKKEPKTTTGAKTTTPKKKKKQQKKKHTQTPNQPLWRDRTGRRWKVFGIDQNLRGLRLQPSGGIVRRWVILRKKEPHRRKKGGYLR